jgi:hypothetical protein
MKDLDGVLIVNDRSYHDRSYQDIAFGGLDCGLESKASRRALHVSFMCLGFGE